MVINEDGRGIVFPYLLEGQSYVHNYEGYCLELQSDAYLFLNLESGLQYTFTKGLHKEYYQLSTIGNRTAFGIELRYDTENRLYEIHDTRQQTLKIKYNKAELLTEAVLYSGSERQCLVSYTYSEDKDLLETTDVMGNKTKFFYKDHLLIRRTDNDKRSFYWKYEQMEGIPRVIHTWGDGELLAGKIKYDPRNHRTKVTEKKEDTYYYYDDNGMIIRMEDHHKRTAKYTYNTNRQPLSYTDIAGRSYRYAYNKSGFLSKRINPDEKTAEYEFDKQGRLIRYQDPEGSISAYAYDDAHKLVELKCNQDKLTFSYQSNGLISHILHNDKEDYLFSYDTMGNIVTLELPDNDILSCTYDKKGNCEKYSRQNGETITYHYDQYSRMIREEKVSGKETGTIRYQYDSQSNLTELKINGKKVHLKDTDAPIVNIMQVNGQNVDIRDAAAISPAIMLWKNLAVKDYILQTVKRAAKTSPFHSLLGNSDKLLELLKEEASIEMMQFPMEEVSSGTIYSCFDPIVLTGAAIRPKLFYTDIIAKKIEIRG